MDRAEQDRLERIINHEVRERFLAGAVRRAVVLQHGDDPEIGAGQLMVRVFVTAEDATGLAAWQRAHQQGMDTFRRELSLRLPAARLLEFTVEGADAPRISVPDDGSLAAEQPSGREIVAKAMKLLRANYVFPDQAERAAAAIEARLEAGEYDGLDEITLIGLVTEHLQELTGDRHLRMGLGGPGPGPGPSPGPGPGRGPRQEPGREPDKPPAREKMRRMERLDNFGIRRVERLDGNVGYIDLRRMAVPANAGPAITAAMELVAGTYALLIDMRHNGGGAPDGVVFWCSYLFGEEPTHLNDIFRADTGETRQFWALPYVPGTRYPDQPVFLLTSARTFSGGEDLCYTLQALGRAEVIGETTGGGAHPTRPFPVSAAVHIAVPFARSVNPVTGTNWQGTGVVPDVAVAAEQAYDVAYTRALERVLAMDDVPPPVADEAREALAGLNGAGLAEPGPPVTG